MYILINSKEISLRSHDAQPQYGLTISPPEKTLQENIQYRPICYQLTFENATLII